MNYPGPQWIKEIRAAGLTTYKIAIAIGYTHPKDVEAIEEGRIPGADKHMMLEALHNVICNSPRPVGHKTANVASASP